LTRIPRIRLLLAAAATLVLFAPACSGDDDGASTPAPTDTATAGNGHDIHARVEITDVRARETLNDTGAVYFTVRSTGEADRLLSASVDPAVADDAQIHESVMEGGNATMREVDGIDVPAGGELVLKPGSYHIMLLGVKEKLSAGDTFTLEVAFEHSGAISLEVTVVAMEAAMGSTMGH